MTHFSPLQLIVLLGLLFSLLPTQSSAQAWKLAKNKNGVQIETRFLKGWSIKEYRATVYIKTTLEEAVDTYRDPVKRKSFMARSLETKNLKVNSKNDIITYNVIKAPWPVTNRDNITHSIFTYSPNKVHVKMKSIPNYIPEKEGLVRIPRSEGLWLFTDQGDGTIKVVQQSVAELGGSVPDWAVNSSIVEGPYDILLALKTVLEQ
ncbi:MAG: START domain-containing protein [Aureispira sp.]